MGVYINLNISYAVTKEEQENYVLYRDLIQQKKYNKYAGDAMWSALPYFTDFEIVQ